MKLIALVITVALWLGVTGLSTPTTKRFSVPLNFNLSNNTEITNTPVQEIDIAVSGDKRKIEQINRAELSATVDISELSSGDRVLSLTPENVAIPLPSGVKVDEILPGRIAVRLEAIEEKDVPVKAEITGQPAAGFEIYGDFINPQRIRVRGPAGFIKTLDFVSTDIIDVSGARDDVSARQVPVGVSNAKAAVFNTVVDVTIRIGEKRVQQTFTISAGGRRYAATLYGPKSVLKNLRSDDLKLEFTSGSDGNETPQVVLPPELQNLIETRSVKAPRSQ